MQQTKTDITEPSDVVLLVDTFYRKVIADPNIGFIFTEVVQLSWERHIPIMYSFWESVLLGTGSYRGNPIMAHVDLDKKIRLEPEHFVHWKRMFHAAVDELFEGQNANLAKERVVMMEQLLLYKIKASREDGFIQ